MTFLSMGFITLEPSHSALEFSHMMMMMMMIILKPLSFHIAQIVRLLSVFVYYNL
jgi:hypothetical protein